MNVSSFVGSRTLNQCSPALQQRFRSEDITEEELVGLMEQFVEKAKKGEHKDAGWPETAYGVSKTGLTVRLISLSPGLYSVNSSVEITDQFTGLKMYKAVLYLVLCKEILIEILLRCHIYFTNLCL